MYANNNKYIPDVTLASWDDICFRVSAREQRDFQCLFISAIRILFSSSSLLTAITMSNAFLFVLRSTESGIHGWNISRLYLRLVFKDFQGLKSRHDRFCPTMWLFHTVNRIVYIPPWVSCHGQTISSHRMVSNVSFSALGTKVLYFSTTEFKIFFSSLIFRRIRARPLHPSLSL